MGFSAMINATDKKNITCRVQEVREDILLWAEGGKKTRRGRGRDD